MARREAARERIIEAALATLKEEGYAQASARAIARSGGFNQGLIYYHFDDLDDLFLEALDLTSRRRLERYRAAIDGCHTASELVPALKSLYNEDLAAGHVAAVQQLIAGASRSPVLGPGIVERVGPWIDYCEEVARRFLAGSPFESLVDPRDLAFAVVAFYMGIETIGHLAPERSRADVLFDTAARFAPLFDSLGS